MSNKGVIRSWVNTLLDDVLCFPGGGKECVSERWSRLRNAGIEELESYGKELIGDFKVLGKGHASVVVRGRHKDFGQVAVKILRVDSKRDDLLIECQLMRLSVPVSPEPYICERDFIVMEYLDGMDLRSYLNERVMNCRDIMLTWLKILGAINWLDKVGVNHKELSILKEHVFVLRDGRIKVIDFESASLGYGCNVCRAFSWLFIRTSFATRFCSSCPQFLEKSFTILREYKAGNLGKFSDLLKLVIDCCLI